MKRSPDFAERERAIDPSASFIVEAPAGSGKTTLLVQRFLNLLAHVERPETVVAMTFTRKAAAEMRQRVIEALQQADEPAANEHQERMRMLAQSVLSRDREQGWALLSDTSRLQIQTIDSLCSMLTRSMPVVSHLGGSPAVVEHAQDLYRTAARQTLRALAEGEEPQQRLFRRIALHFDNALDQVETHIVKMLEKREQWRAFQNQHHAEPVQMFCDLLGAAEEQLRHVFRQAGELDFTAITRAAIDALGAPDTPSDLLYWLDYRIEHLLVDEFQDTSLAQYELIDKLTGQWSEGDSRTLFLVGDPMQSIYRFREAEVGLFLRCWQRQQLGSVRLRPLRLLANFRSTPEIVQWTQNTFAPVMDQDDLPRGGVKLRPAEATRENSGVEPSLSAFVNDENGSAEAAEIVRIILNAPSRDGVAILVRSRPQLAAILPALRANGIQYEAVDIDELQNQQHVLDLISLTRALLHLGDRTAWLACLRAPWCGLGLYDLSALAEGETATVYDLLNRPEKVWTLSPHGRERAIRAGEVLREAATNVGRMGLRTLVERTWMALGGPAALTQTNHRKDADTYFDLLEQSESGGMVKDFTLLEAKLEFLYARPASGTECVKVMTVHTAKGLEFDTVILPQAAKRARSTDSELLLWTEEIGLNGEPQLLLAALPKHNEEDPDYKRVKDEIKIQEQNELKRLFYVAATRAKNRLHILGSVKEKKGNDVSKASENTFLGLIWPQVQEEFRSALRRKAPAQQSLNFTARSPNELRRLPAGWRAPKLDSSVEWRPQLQPAAASARRITYEWVSDTARHVGTLVHEVMKRAAREGAAAWPSTRVNQLAPVFRSELLRQGVSDEEEPAATAKIVRAVSAALSSERGRWVLAAHQEARSEWAVAGRLGDKLVSGSVDRIFRDELGQLWIVDFKTSEHEGGNLKKFLAEEQRRYREQLETYAAVVARMLPGPISLGLYFPLHDAWLEWEYAEVAVTAI